MAIELRERVGLEGLYLWRGIRNGDDDLGPGDVQADVAVDVVGGGYVGRALQGVLVDLVRLARAVSGLPVQQGGLEVVVFEVGNGIERAGVAVGVPDGTFEE